MEIKVKVTKVRLVLFFILALFVNKAYRYFRQPFMFELFSGKEEAREYLNKEYFRKEYPKGWLGRNGEYLAKQIEKMGGECFLHLKPNRRGFDEDIKYHHLYFCEYYNDFISRLPFHYYRVIIYVDEDDIILRNNVYLLSKEYFP